MSRSSRHHALGLQVDIIALAGRPSIAGLSGLAPEPSHIHRFAKPDLVDDFEPVTLVKANIRIGSRPERRRFMRGIKLMETVVQQCGPITLSGNSCREYVEIPMRCRWLCGVDLFQRAHNFIPQN